MKKIEFGYSNDIDPKGSWSGIGIKEGLMLLEANYYGSIEYNGNNYLVAKVEKDEYDHYPQLVGKFIVRDALAEMFADGSGLLLLDQEQSHEAMKFEEFLDDERVISRINSINDIIDLLDGVTLSNNYFKVLEMNDRFISTSINHNSFVEKNEAIKSCHSSFSQMQKEISELENSMSR